MVDTHKRKHLKELSFKLRSAIEILDARYGNITQVRNFLNTKLTNHLKESTFSKYIGAHIKSQYLNSIQELTFRKVFEILDPFLKNEFHFEWNIKSKKYEELTEDVSNQRLEGLNGTWKGFSWDATTTKITGVDHIHVFKLSIKTTNNIICVTKRTTFQGNRMILIGNDRIAIELSNNHRKLFIIMQIGNGELDDLRGEKIFYLAYTDSGNTKVKSGLAILERIETQLFDILTPESKPIAFLEDTNESYFIDFLRGTQLIID